jgi:hypothetical protein
MKKAREKAICFLTAIADVYRDEEHRELYAFPKMDFSDDVTDDFTAMLLAMSVLAEEAVGYDGDIIDFTHMLNKLAIQYVMDGEGKDNGK